MTLKGKTDKKVYIGLVEAVVNRAERQAIYNITQIVIREMISQYSDDEIMVIIKQAREEFKSLEK